MRIAINLISVALFLSCLSATAGLPRTRAQGMIGSAVAQGPVSGSVTGIFAMKMSGDTIVDINRNVRMVPASNMKLITTGLALNTLGEDYRFETSIAYSGEIADGVLHGDLYIIGGGDPTTGSKSHSAMAVAELFSKWLGLVWESGIRSIDGKVIGDPRFFQTHTPHNLGWTYDDLGSRDGAGPLGLNFFENSQNFHVTAGSSVGSRPSVRAVYPELPWLVCLNAAVTGPAGSANSLFYVNSDFGPEGEIRGSFPVDRKGAYLLECSNRFGALTCAYYFHNYLKKNGVSVKGGYADVTNYGHVRSNPGNADSSVSACSSEDLHRIGSTYSAPLSEIAADTNYESNNFYAETMFRMIGLEKRQSVDHGLCQKAADDALAELGLRNAGRVQIFDGSGLSRKNYVSADFFVRFLRAMVKTPVFGTYLKSLPVPGGDGTLKTRLPKASQETKSRIFMKSGSMNGVRCYSGYILPKDGNPDNIIAFSLLLNNLTSSTWAVNPVIDNIIESLAAEN